VEPWIAYHGRMFGHENLFVFDNGSNSQRALKALQKYADKINLVTDRTRKIDFEQKGDIFGELIRSLDQDNGPDFFVPLDCDEFVALNIPGNGISCAPDSVSSYFGGLIGDPRVLTIKGSYFNVPGQPLKFYRRAGRKCFFASGTFLTIDIGFHRGQSRHTTEEHQTDIVHIHFQNKPFQTFQTHARQKLQGRVPNFYQKRWRIIAAAVTIYASIYSCRRTNTSILSTTIRKSGCLRSKRRCKSSDWRCRFPRTPDQRYTLCRWNVAPTGATHYANSLTSVPFPSRGAPRLRPCCIMAGPGVSRWVKST
jgi:hypothetical protein